MFLGTASFIDIIEVELLIGLGGFTAYQTLTNSEYYHILSGCEAAGAKVRGREGNNPDYHLRPLNLR